MTQHGEETAVVRGLSLRIRRGLRSAATVALTAGLAFTVATASALPVGPGPGPHGAARIEAAASAAHDAGASVSQRHPRRVPARAPGRVAAASASKSSSDSAVRDAATGAAAAVPLIGLLALGGVTSTPAANLLRYRIRASRTRGQPDQG